MIVFALIGAIAFFFCIGGLLYSTSHTKIGHAYCPAKYKENE